MRYGLAGKKTYLCFVACLITMLLIFSSSHAQTISNETLHSRIIVQWKENKVRTRAQVMEAANTRLKNNVNHTVHLRRSISAHMDAMQLETPQHAAEFAKTLAALNANPDVEFAVEDKRRHAMALPDDQYFTASSNRTGQWYLNDPAANSQWASAINAINAWNYSTGGSAGNGIIIADVDTGVIFNHPDLLPVASGGKLLPGYDFVDCDLGPPCTASSTYYAANDGDGWDIDPSDPGDWVSNQDETNHPKVFDSSCEVGSSSWHGTRVSGILGALTNNGIGIAGTGYNARILPVRALGKCGGFDSDIIAGMQWAAGIPVSGAPINLTPAKIINLSLGGADTCSPAYQNAVNSILALGITIVASAGNDSATTNAPANCKGVIGVTAIRNAGSKVGFSSLGPQIAISAPGGNCVNTSGPCLFSIDTTYNLGTLSTQDCTQPGGSTTPCYTTPGANDYTDESNPNLGTSFSAPIVSGTIALMLGANPNLTPSVIASRLKATATAFPQPSGIPACVTPTGTTPVATNEAECSCTTSLCGAGMVNALKAVQSVTPPTITINGNTTVTASGTDMLDASSSTAADRGTLTYAWTILSGGGQLSGASASTTTVTAPNTNATLVVKLTVSETEQPDNWVNTASQNFNITVGSGASSSSSSSTSSSSSSVSSTSSSSSSSSASSSSSSASSASSSSASSTSSSSSSMVGNSSSASSVAMATKGGGSFGWGWIFSLAALFLLREKLISTTR